MTEKLLPTAIGVEDIDRLFNRIKELRKFPPSPQLININFDGIPSVSKIYYVVDETIIQNQLSGYRIDFNFQKLERGMDVESISKETLENINDFIISMKKAGQEIHSSLVDAFDLILFNLGYKGKYVLIESIENTGFKTIAYSNLYAEEIYF